MWLAFFVSENHFLLTKEQIIIHLISMILVVIIFYCVGVYKFTLTFFDLNAIKVLIVATIYYAVFLLTTVKILFQGDLPITISLAQPIFFLIVILSFRIFLNKIIEHGINNKNLTINKKGALIYGAGSAGRQIAAGLFHSNEITPVAFIDENPNYWGAMINGLLVYPPSKISYLLKSKKIISDVLVAIPSLSKSQQKRILNNLSSYPVQTKVLPGLSEVANGIVKIDDLREVNIDDVLGREPIEPYDNLLRENIYHKSVLVTGAGGSIGSELCRQVITLNPLKLILFELNEFALYNIERELKKINCEVEIISVLGSVLDKNLFKQTLIQNRIQTIYHAAAYKHVPMIEKNLIVGISNNTFGTLNAVLASCEVGVEVFVLISTDKAVRPTSIMGCSKRLSELVLQAVSNKENNLGFKKTKLCMVRFGNVLGSSGSVVPLFLDQIKSGGPVTVTHPEIVRYFMTTQEAAQLVIQAGAIGMGGDVMVLDMGDQIKILDLARRMIHLSGYSYRDYQNPNGEIEIIFSGLRPGEKLYEELLIGNNTFPTAHPRILRAEECNLSWNDLQEILTKLEIAIISHDTKMIIDLLKLALPEFQTESASNEIN